MENHERCSLDDCRGAALIPADVADGRYCSPSHADIADSRLPFVVCVVCRVGKRFRSGSGRPRHYCSDDCRRVRQREVAVAVKELGRDDPPPDDPDEAREMLRRAEVLGSYWFGRDLEPEWRDLARQHWGGCPPAPTRPPGNRQVELAVIARIVRLRAASALTNVPTVPLAERWEAESAAQRRSAAADAKAWQRIDPGRRDALADRDKVVTEFVAGFSEGDEG